MSQLKVNSIIPVGGVASGQGGGIIQVVSSTKTDTASSTSTSFTDTGISASITPSSSSNKILIVTSVYWSHSGSPAMVLNLVRGSTNISQPAVTSGSHAGTVAAWVNALSMSSHTITFLDSPNTTSSTTYKIQWKSTNGGTIQLNSYVNATSQYHGTSTISLFEVSG
jgi:hypothetical protein